MQPASEGRPRLDAGRAAATLLFPQVVLGAFLALVPDNVFFVGTEFATLAHVAIGMLTLPVIVVLGLHHGRRLAPALQSTRSRLVTVAFVVTVIGACASGVAATFAYARTPARVHAVLGIALALPMALHLLLARRRALGIAAVALFGLSILGVAWIRSRAPLEPVEPLSPEFASRLNPGEAYDDSEWCGECHRDEYGAWSRSTHARTLDLTDVYRNYVGDPGQRGHRLTEGQAVTDGTVHRDGLAENIRSFDACVSCHAPLAYYSDAPEPLEPRAKTGGVGCVFCHTLRGVRKGHRVSDAMLGLLRGKPDFDPQSVFASRVDYVSAPQTVRRYLFQASGSKLARWIGNTLIRLRPAMHSHDYGGAFLREDGACRTCHAFAWTTPAESLNVVAPDPRTPRTVGSPAQADTCWHCHMRDGADATHAVSHLFLGGNAKAAANLGDESLASAEHDYGLKGPKVAVTNVALRDGALDVAVDVRSRLPHAFPTTTGEARVAWLRVFALDAQGSIIADTQGDGIVPESLVVPGQDRMEPYEQRTFSASLAVKDMRPRKIVAELYHSFDAAPIAVATTSAD